MTIPKKATPAIFNGTIVDIGNWIDEYGFEWKLGEEGEVFYIPIGSEQHVTTFEYWRDLLIKNSTYYCRARGHNEKGIGYGVWVEFIEGPFPLKNGLQLKWMRHR